MRDEELLVALFLEFEVEEEAFMLQFRRFGGDVGRGGNGLVVWRC